MCFKNVKMSQEPLSLHTKFHTYIALHKCDWLPLLNEVYPTILYVQLCIFINYCPFQNNDNIKITKKNLETESESTQLQFRRTTLHCSFMYTHLWWHTSISFLITNFTIYCPCLHTLYTAQRLYYVLSYISHKWMQTIKFLW